MFKTETELQLELFPRNWTETETEIMSGTEISLVRMSFWTQSSGISKILPTFYVFIFVKVLLTNKYFKKN